MPIMLTQTVAMTTLLSMATMPLVLLAGLLVF